MSTPPKDPNRKRITLTKLAEMRALGEPIVMITAYDHPTAKVAEAAGVDVVLVGDSAANNVLGYDDTLPVTVEELLMLSAAVRRGLRTPLLVADLPFGSYEASDAHAIETAHRFVKEAGCDAVKLEGGGTSVERARAIVRAGVPVMGHVGLTPQTATMLGGYRAQGRTAARARQVLVLHDLLGIHDGFKPKFVKRYADVKAEMLRGVREYAEEVRTRAFPKAEHTYGIAPEELERFRTDIADVPIATQS